VAAVELVECVPNFSEGRDRRAIEEIVAAAGSVRGVEVLHMDAGHDAHRTVVTLVGTPEALVEAAFLAIDQAARSIDMRRHKGAHPRIGATDVCPFIPLAGVTMDRCVQLACSLGKRVGRELGIPVYLYGEAAKDPQRASLAAVRKGEYEGLGERIVRDGFRPDFGPHIVHPVAGATAIGARKLLIAFNVNLDTRDVKAAQAVAKEIREHGRGGLKGCRAMGWLMPRYRCAQVSMNLVDYRATPLQAAFEEVKRLAAKRGVRVKGSELVGMAPLEALIEAGRFYARQGSGRRQPKDLIAVAVKNLGLRSVRPFDPEASVLEYRIEQLGGAPAQWADQQIARLAH